MTSGPNTKGSMDALLRDTLTRITLLERRLAIAGGGSSGGSSVSAGMMQPFAGASAPAGWLVCDGAAVSRTTYAELFNVIGTTWGAGNGSTTFNLPDMRGRTTFGRDTAQTEFNALAESGGAKTHRHDFRFGLFDKNWTATGSYAGMEDAAQPNANDKMGAYRYSTGAFQGAVAGTPSQSTATNLATNSATNGGTLVTSQLNRMFSTGDTATPTGTTGLPPYVVTNWIIATASGAGLQPTMLMNQGTTAQRNAIFGSPTTDAQRVALANQVVSWYNTELGWWETYYATTGLSGLTARGLVSGVTSGWYPNAGAPIYATQRRTVDTSVGAGATAVIAFNTTTAAAGFAGLPATAMTVPYAGNYEVSGSLVAAQTGGNYANMAILLNDSSIVGETGSVFPHTNGYSIAVVTPFAYFAPAGSNFKMNATLSSAGTVVGSSPRLTVRYLGPALVYP
jgi:microcystin-dependent protein